MDPWRQPIGQPQEAGSEERQHGDPGGLDLAGRDQRPALLVGLHLGEIGPRPDEAGALGRVVRRPGLRLRGLVAQVADIAPHRADEIILPALRLRDDPLAAQLLHPAFREIEQPRDHADGLGRR